MTFLAEIFPLFWVSTHVPNFVLSEIYSILGRLLWQILKKSLFFLLKYVCYRLISSIKFHMLEIEEKMNT